MAARDILNESLRYISENKINAIVAQLVEYNLAKVGVAGSSPVYRSFFMPIGRWAFLFVQKVFALLNNRKKHCIMATGVMACLRWNSYKN